MKDKKSFGEQLEAFFEGKGFYIVLSLCAVVIGVSAWVLFTGTNVEDVANAETELLIPDVPNSVVMTSPDEEVTPEPIPTVKPTPAPTPETVVDEEKAEQEETTADEETMVEEEAAAVFNEETVAPPPLYVRPVHGETLTPHTVDELVYDETMEDWRVHIGMDIASEVGTQVLAVSAGVVKSIINDPLYGTTVIITHQNEVESIYSNLATQPTVYEGHQVNVGDVIGAVGETAIGESAQASHLHFSMTEKGVSVDPEVYLP